MATVYLATRPGIDDDARYVIKVPREQVLKDRNLAPMFLDEIALSASLEHPNIVTTYEYDAKNLVPYAVMEFVDGASLLELVVASGALPESTAIFLVSEILRGLSYAHKAVGPDGSPKNIVHRDISPGNILISRNGDVKLADFGIARSTGRIQAPTRTGTTKGKTSYMSPEQISASKRIDSRSDLFTIGIILAEQLMGKKLYRAKTQFELWEQVLRADLARLHTYGSHIPLALQSVLIHALQRDPEKRFQDAEEFREALTKAAPFSEESEGTKLAKRVSRIQARAATTRESTGEHLDAVVSDIIANSAPDYLLFELAITPTTTSLAIKRDARMYSVAPLEERLESSMRALDALMERRLIPGEAVGSIVMAMKMHGQELGVALAQLGLVQPQAGLSQLVALAESHEAWMDSENENLAGLPTVGRFEVPRFDIEIEGPTPGNSTLRFTWTQRVPGVGPRAAKHKGPIGRWELSVTQTYELLGLVFAQH